MKNLIDISPAIPKSLPAHREQQRSLEPHMNFKKVPETSYNITPTPFLIVLNMTVAYDTATNLVQAIRSALQVYQQASLRCQNVTNNNLKCLTCR